MTYYIIENGEIINAVETDTLHNAMLVTKGMIGNDLTCTASPTAGQLERYRYWHERP